MSHFVYDNTALDFPKTDLEALPPGADPTQYVVSVEWNRLCQATTDIKNELRGAKWFGLEAQSSDPGPVGITNYMYLLATGVLVVQFGVSTFQLVNATRQINTSGGITGGAALSADLNLALETLGPSPAGTYSAANIVVDSHGRVTSASNGVSGYVSMVNNVSALTARGALEVDGSNLVLTDDAGNHWTALRLSPNISVTTVTSQQALVKTHSGFTGSEDVTETGAIQTIDATLTEVLSIPLNDDTVYAVSISVIGRDIAGAHRAMYGRKALFYREGTGATLQGSIQNLHTDVETNAGLNATMAGSGNNVSVTVTGLAATTINWVVTARIQAVSGSS